MPHPQDVNYSAGMEEPSSVPNNYLWRYNYSEYGPFLFAKCTRLCGMLYNLVLKCNTVNDIMVAMILAWQRDCMYCIIVR